MNHRSASVLGILALLGACLAAACKGVEAPAGGDRTPTPAPALAFAAGGSIYGLYTTGEVRQLVAGDRASDWNASPTLSPDGSRIAYTCGFDICVAEADGTNERTLATVAQLSTPPGGGGSDWSLGAQSVVWSPDGQWIAYTLAHIGGGGVLDLWVMRADGSDRRELYEGGSWFYRPAWAGADHLAVAEGDMLTMVRRAGGTEEAFALPPEAASFAQTAIEGLDGQWLVGAVTSEQPILYGTGAGMRDLTGGVSPALSPDGRLAAYFRDDAVYVVATAGGDERKLADAAPFGGRDRFFGEQPHCFPDDAAACSYRFPSLTWNPAAYDAAYFEPTPAPTATLPPGARRVTGLFTDPRPAIPDETRTLGLPPSAFQPWDGVSTVLYDLETLTETNLGPGSLGSFNPDESKMVWVSGESALAGGEAWLLDLATMARRSLGPARLAFFLDDGTVAITFPGGNEAEILNLNTGERRSSPFIPTGPPSQDVKTPGGFLLRRQRLTDFDRSLFTLEDLGSGRVLLQFEAYAAVPAGPDALAVATLPAVDDPQAPLWRRTGTVNVFLVAIPTGEATFVATAAYADPNWPLAANDRYVVWTEGYCSIPQGKTRLYDRLTSQLIELDASLWATFTPDGLVADGGFGPRAFIDPKTWQYRAVIEGAGDTSHSRSYRYVTAGQYGGHGGLCP